MLREYKDRKGVQWRVWDVYPEPRISGPSRLAEGLLNHFPHKDLSEGWLCFESAIEKRRVAPIPYGWELMPPASLEDLCSRAGFVSRSDGPGERTTRPS